MYDFSGFTKAINSEDEAIDLQKELGISEACAEDVVYLRERTRHTPELEAELIALHKAGRPPNIMEFGTPSKAMETALINILAQLKSSSAG